MAADIIIIGMGYAPPYTIPGTIIDIYLVYAWALEQKYNVTIITDIATAVLPDEALTKIISGDVPLDILQFIKDYTTLPALRIIDGKTSFLAALKAALTSTTTNKLHLYYTGHGLDGSLMIARKITVPTAELRDLVLLHTKHTVDICFVFDCCHADHLSMAYELRDGTFHLRRGSWLAFRQNILVICSNKPTEKSTAREYGSFFTRLFMQLREVNMALIQAKLTLALKGCKSGYDQTVCIYSSFHIPLPMWPWMIKRDRVIVKSASLPSSVEYEVESDCLVVTREQEEKSLTSAAASKDSDAK